MSDSPRSAATARPGLSALVAAAVCTGMLTIAVSFPPREGGAAIVNDGLADRAGWPRMGALEGQDLSVDILSRGGEHRYTVRRGDRTLAERITADELLRRWGIDARTLRAEGASGMLMMVDPDAAALTGR